MPEKKYATNLSELITMSRQTLYDYLSTHYPSLLKNPPTNTKPNKTKYQPMINMFESLGLNVPEDFPYNKRERAGVMPAYFHSKALTGEDLHTLKYGGNIKNLI